MEIELKMPRTEFDGDTGINDGNIETYKNKPMMSLTKEEIQNSSGAFVDPNKPVIVEFHSFDLPVKDIPDSKRLIEVFDDEVVYWSNMLKNDTKAIRFLDKARQLLKKPTIPCMRISDYNTTGLTGVRGNSTPYKNLVKNRGVSDKPQNATGSFGIGSDAAFASSETRTVFYNTINTDPCDNMAFQGVLRLPSYKKDNNNYVGDGFFSAKSNDTKTDPIMESISLDPDYTRNEPGMDKFIIGFPISNKEELKRQLIASSINNFLYAIWANKLEVRYDDVVVNSASLDNIMELYQEEIDQTTKEYYEVLKNPDEVQYVTIFDENDVKLLVKLQEGFSRRAAITRQSGMKVFDKGYISSRIEFAGVVILQGDNVNGYFKKLENPEHTNWAEDRAEAKTEMKRNQNLIFDKLRQMIKDLHQENYSETIDADGVGDYLPFAYVTGKKKSVEGLTNEVEKRIPAKKKKRKTRPIIADDVITYQEDEQGNIIEDTIQVNTPQNSGGHGGGGEHNGETQNVPTNLGGDNSTRVSENSDGVLTSKRKIPADQLKFALSNVNDTYHLKLACETSIKRGFAEILVAGEKGSGVIPISSATVDGQAATVKKNKIVFNSLPADSNHEIDFSFIRPGNWAIEVIIHEN